MSPSTHTESPPVVPTVSSAHMSSDALAGILAIMLTVSIAIAIYWYKKCKEYQRSHDLMQQIKRLELMWQRSTSQQD